MSKKTFKRVALGVVVSMVLAPFAAIAPSQAVATTLTASSVTGTVVASASTTTGSGTFSVTLVEDTGNVWSDDAEIRLELVDKYADDTTCDVKANTDGSPAGTVTVTGVSDTLFSVAGYAPELEVVDGDLVVSITGAYTDAAELEHIVISGLTASCSADAPLGNIYVEVVSGNAELDPANVVIAGTLNTPYVDNDLRVALRMTDGNFPLQAAAGASSHAIGSTGTATRVAHSAVTVSPLFINPASSYAGQVVPCTNAAPSVCTLNDHGLRTGDPLFISAIGDAVIANGDTTGNTLFAIRVTANTFQVADTSTLAAAGTGLEFTTASTTMRLKYTGSGTPGSFTVADQNANIGSTGTAVNMPTNSHTAVSFGTNGLATSNIYLGKIGTVGATVNVFATGTQTAFEAATNLTTTATEGQINIDAVTANAIVDGLTVNPTVVVTLTNGVFQSAPTVTGGTISGSQTYPSATLTFTPTANAIDIIGTYRFNAGTAAGTFMTFAVAVNNTTAPVTYTASTQNTRIAVLQSATGRPVAAATLSTGAAGVAGAVVTTTESAAGAFRTGRYVAICFADATGNDVFNVDNKFVWATVTTGDLKLDGNVTTIRATMTNDVGVTAYDGSTNQCAQVRVFSASTAASTITWSAGTATAAESAVPFNMNVGSANGVVRMGIVVGSAVNNGQVFGTFTMGNRTTANNYTVAVGSAASVLLPAAGAAMPNITITEAARGRFAAGTITIQLSNSLGVDNNISAFTATSGADAPVVTQTAATSDIAWTYAVIADRVTITVASGSTNVPAQFVISNIKLNVASTTASGLAVTDNDIFAVVSGASVANNSWYTKLSNVTAPEVVVDPVAPELAITKNNGRVFLTGLCQAEEGDVVVYVKSPGKPWKELAKTAECFAGAFDADRMAPKSSKLYRVKQEGTGLFSNQVLVRP